jgi:hypothetical protein
MEARDAARTRLAVVEAAAETARAQVEREASATRKRAEELEDALQAAQVMRPRLTRCMSCNDIECSVIWKCATLEANSGLRSGELEPNTHELPANGAN